MKTLRVVAVCWLLVAWTAAVADAQHQSATPSLVVVISVDQLRYEYIERFAPWFSAGGFNRFIKSGATFPDTHYLHAVTFTGPGHATIGSGKNPAEHGIVGNTWFERDSAVDTKRWDWYFEDSGGYEPPAKPAADPSLPPWFQSEGHGAPRYCAYDDTVAVTAGHTSGMSPRSLIGEGLGDRIKAKYPASRVIGMAIKDRAAILMAGRNADAAYWFDQHLPGFVSSTYYHFDPKVFSFNPSISGYIPGSKQWQPSGIIPPADLKRVTFDPPEAWKLKNARYNGTFPHPVTDVRSMTYSPFANDMTADFALWLINAESLGSNATPDVLFVGFSATDYFGHYYGPDSMEAADGVVRLDRALQRLLDALDRRFGDRVVVALTADHGVQSTPEILKLRDPSADAGRVDLRNPSRRGQRISDLPPLRIEIEKQLASRLHVPFSADAPYAHALVFFFEEPALYINLDRVRALKLDPERVKRELRDVVLKLPGVDHAWTGTELESAGRNPGEVEERVRRSYLKERSGDVLITLRPNWIWSWGSNSTTHGQPVENDTHVPLLFWGAGVKTGRYDVAASPDDLARTLGAIVGVDAGGADAKVLPCASLPAAPASAGLETVLAMALRLLDPQGKDSLIAGPKLSAAARAAASATRGLAPPQELVTGVIRVDTVEINGDRATVQLWTGPIPKLRPGVMLLDCGTGHTFAFERVDGQWKLKSQGLAQC